MTTEAGKRLLAALCRVRETVPASEQYVSQQYAVQDALAYVETFLVEPAIPAIEAEAVAEYRRELAERVRGHSLNDGGAWLCDEYDCEAKVLALLGETP